MRQLGALALVLATAAWTGHAAPPVKALVAPDGNEARYRVREQLVGVDFPNDAVGSTREITGQIVLGDHGTIVAAQSRITVNVASLKSDRDRRDAFLRRTTLATDSFPTVTLVPKAFEGVPQFWPDTATITFQLVGDLTVRGVTKPTRWQVTARADTATKTWSGTASTKFTFADFQITQPKIRILLTVADTIKLEYDFKFVKDTTR